MASRKVVQSKSAFSTPRKRSILLEEGLRRLRNCSPELEWTDKVVFLNRFSSDMKRSGHNASFRKTVLCRVVKRYQADLSNHLEGRKCQYRSRRERIEQNHLNKKNSQKDTWFRSSGATSILTVPATPGGNISRRSQEEP